MVHKQMKIVIEEALQMHSETLHPGIPQALADTLSKQCTGIIKMTALLIMERRADTSKYKSTL